MYHGKKNLLVLERITFNVITNSVPFAESSAETLKRFGYISIDNIKTQTLIEKDNLRIRFVN